jgi:hypothetical protein
LHVLAQKEVVMTDIDPTVIRWENPPSQRSPRTDWQPTANMLIERREWGVVQEHAKSAGLTSHIKTGRLKAFRPVGAFDSRSVKNDDGTYDIYAVYVGDSEGGTPVFDHESGVEVSSE